MGEEVQLGQDVNGEGAKNEDTAASTAEKTPQAGKEVSVKKKKGKTTIVLGVVAVVLVVTGIGFFIWHEQPSFCNAICHTPMDPYNETYNQEAGVAGFDKWGNKVDNTNAMLCVSHVNNSGTTCMDCHVPTLGEQITEGMHWVSGSYEYPLTERSFADLTEARGLKAEEFCLNESCHNMTTAELGKATSDMERNPHQMPQTAQHKEIQCGDCHKAHRASVMVCTDCHEDSQVPDGWLTNKEAKKLG